MRQELPQAEFHIYEMITRIPAAAREPARPLALPQRYPRLTGLEDGSVIKKQLATLADEVLEVRRRWHETERGYS